MSIQLTLFSLQDFIQKAYKCGVTEIAVCQKKEFTNKKYGTYDIYIYTSFPAENFQIITYKERIGSCLDSEEQIRIKQDQIVSALQDAGFQILFGYWK